MEEDEYKSSYNELASVRCVFEKALTSHQAKCPLSRHFCLADREGYSCEEISSSSKCRQFLKLLRENSLFALKLKEIDGQLPHNMEIRVQVGGVSGIAKMFDHALAEQTGAVKVDDIQAVLKRAVKDYGSLEKLPYSQIIQSVVQYKGRRKRQH